MVNDRALSKTAFTGSLILVAIIVAIYLYNIVQWQNYPDFGFAFTPATGLTTVGMVMEHGRLAGMEPGDRILTVNGKSYRTLKEFRAAMNREGGGDNTYLLERDGRKFDVTIVNIPIGLEQALSRSGLPFVVGICYALIGTLVFLMKAHNRTSWVFYLFAATFGLYITFLYKSGEIWPAWLENVQILVYTFTPAVILQLTLNFPEERGLLRANRYLQSVPYLISVVMFIGFRSSAPNIGEAPRIWFLAAVGYVALAVLLFLGSCVQLLVTSSSEIVKVRSKMILLGSAITASLPLANLVSGSVLGRHILPSINYQLPFLVVFPLFVGYSIVRHDLFEFDTIIKRTYGYILTTGAVAGAYGICVLVSNVAFGRFEITKSPLFPIGFVLAVVFFFNPLRNRAQRFIDRVFYRLEYDYQETVQKISETMRSLMNLDQITKTIMDTALGTMFIDSGCVMLLGPRKESYECFAFMSEKGEQKAIDEREKAVERGGRQAPKELEARTTKEVRKEAPKSSGENVMALPKPDLELRADDPFIQKMAQRKKEVTIYDIQEDPSFEVEKEHCMKAVQKMEATLVIPLIYEDRLTGLISLGQKKSGKFYRREDINLLTILANQGAVAIENALMVEDVIEKERMDEELAIARDLQMSMLPASCPKVAGFGIAALSIPAREVGGDFFDFIEMGEGALGLIVGDVMGKSVSGALVMAASRTLFRNLSEEKLGVGDMMIRANARLNKDVKPGMFVALLYALLEPRERILRLCSGGQTQPIHFSARTGEAKLVQTAGETFPLGILPEVGYEEMQLKLEPGDRVIFYTDGIAEAQSESGEVFGFDRLVELARVEHGLESEALLKKVMDEVNKFVGRAPQHDDLTMIVLTVGEAQEQ